MRLKGLNKSMAPAPWSGWLVVIFLLVAAPKMSYADCGCADHRPLLLASIDEGDIPKASASWGPKEALEFMGDAWGYGYGDLLHDLSHWSQSPYVNIDSIGHSVEGRAIWVMRITSDQPETEPRRTITIHARTHPGEVQSWHVTHEMIKLILSETPFGRHLRNAVVWHIVPMLNPDGVENDIPRHNANDVDLEREWDKSDPQPEAAALKQYFTDLMASDAPIRLALNMHSAYACKRYFVYHDEAGTSPQFAADQRDFINAVRTHDPEGIEAWDYLVSWKDNTPTHFPESWFWLNFNENVMALTYEDMNCATAGNYDRTAEALLRGIRDYLKLPAVTDVDVETAAEPQLRVFPNPVIAQASIRFTTAQAGMTTLNLYNNSGIQVRQLNSQYLAAGNHTIRADFAELPAGAYTCELNSPDGRAIVRVILIGGK